MADRVIQAVKSGAIRRFFLIAGCDGARSGRSYYTELAQSIPQDCIILTLACSNNRFNKLDSGEIGGLPRLLDIGQCNDTYSALQIALALAKAFDRGVNDLRLSLVLSWYEQKALGVLLTLLHLRVRNIRIGPTLQRSSQARCFTSCARIKPSRALRTQPWSRTPIVPRGVDRKLPAPHDQAHRRGKDDAGLVATTPYVKLYFAGAMYPLIGAFSPWSNLCASRQLSAIRRRVWEKSMSDVEESM